MRKGVPGKGNEDGGENHIRFGLAFKEGEESFGIWLLAK